MRDDAVRARSVTSPEEYQQHIQLANDIAVFLRRNIVQGVKMAEATQDGAETWRAYLSPGASNWILKLH